MKTKLIESDILKLVTRWFEQLDLKLPLDEFVPMLDEEQLEMRFPEGTFNGIKDFSRWLSYVQSTYFDTKHTLRVVDIAFVSCDTAKVKVIVNWQARSWKPPALKSDYMNFDAHQTWIVKLCQRTGKATISKYFVESLEEQQRRDQKRVNRMDVRTLLEKYFISVNEGDWDTWLSLFDENAMVVDQLAGRIEGIDKLRGFVDGLNQGYSRFENHPLHLVVEGNRAVAVCHIVAANIAGDSIDTNVVDYFEVEDGKITYVVNFKDSVKFKPFTDQKMD